MRIRGLLHNRPVTRITGAAIGAAGLAFIGFGTAGVGTVTGGASTTNNCTPADVLAKGTPPQKVISNDPHGCDIAGNSTSNPAVGYISFHMAASGTTTIEDLFQSVGSDQDFYVGSYAVSFGNLVDQTTGNAVSTMSGSYTLAPGADDGETGPNDLAATYPTEPTVSGTLPTISGTAGDVITASYQVTFTGTTPNEVFPSGRNDIWFNNGSTEYEHTSSNSVKLFGTEETTTTTTTTPTTTTTTPTTTTTTTTTTTPTTTTTSPTTTTPTTTTTSPTTTTSTTTPTTTTPTANTGADVQFGAGLALLIIGGGVTFGGSRVGRRKRK